MRFARVCSPRTLRIGVPFSDRGELPKAIVRAIGCSKFCVLSLLLHMSADAYGDLYRQWSDPRLRDKNGILPPLGGRFRHFIDTIVFKAVVDVLYMDMTLA